MAASLRLMSALMVASGKPLLDYTLGAN